MFKSIPKLMDFVGRRVISKEKLADFDDVIQRLSHEILSITLTSILPITLKSISSLSHSVEKKNLRIKNCLKYILMKFLKFPNFKQRNHKYICLHPNSEIKVNDSFFHLNEFVTHTRVNTNELEMLLSHKPY